MPEKASGDEQVETREVCRSYPEGHLEPEIDFCGTESRSCPPLGVMSSHRKYHDPTFH